MQPRRLILCFDGTAGQYDSTNTNVVKLFSLLKKDTEEQLSYYQAGIGTYFSPSVVAPAFIWFAKMMDEAVAWNLDAHVMQGYQYLMNNYREGDKICLFGFSRGAYTARALAGMLNKVGLLPRFNTQQVSFAYKIYRSSNKGNKTLAAGFKQTFCRDVNVEFVGVWDTVQSTGILMSRSLPFTDNNTRIKTFRQALALDEHRAKFRPNLYHITDTNKTNAGMDPEHASATRLASSRFVALRVRVKNTINTVTRRGRLWKRMGMGSDTSPSGQEQVASDGGEHDRPSHAGTIDSQIKTAEIVLEGDAIPALTPAPAPPEPAPPQPTDVLEVWFAGCHSDVGGGAVADSVDTSLSNITLQWMVDQIVASQCGILFDREALERNGITATFSESASTRSTSSSKRRSASQQSHLCVSLERDGSQLSKRSISHTRELLSTPGPPVVRVPATPENPTPPTPDPAPARELKDALAPLHDQLQIQKLWWLLEIIPFDFAWQTSDGTWHKKWSIHLGRGRFIPDLAPKFHYSVKERMDDTTLNYKPKAAYENGHEVFVN